MEPPSTEAEPLIVVRKDPSGVAHIVINRPRSLNSLTRPMIVDLAGAFRALDADDSVGAIVLSGAGRAFCSGVDLTAAEAVFKGDVKDEETDPVCQMGRCRKPIVGAITGFAVTGGFEIALACDVLVAGRGAKFIDTHARFGIFPSWGLSQKLSRIIGPNRAREISLTATPITAEMAEKWGLVNHVVDSDKVLSKATEVAEAMLRNNRDLVLRYKAVINDGLKLDLDHALALEKVTEELLWELFVQAGPVVNVYVPKDRVTNLHQGYGFAEFRSEEDADYAIKILNMIKLYGKPIRVNKASQDKKSLDVGANLFVGNLDPDVDEKLLYDTFSAFGVIVTNPKIMRDPETGNSRGFGFISYDSFEASDAAIEAMNGQYLCNRQITVSYAYKKDTKGERHGTPAERVLAASNPGAQKSRPHTMFASGPPTLPNGTPATGTIGAPIPPRPFTGGPIPPAPLPSIRPPPPQGGVFPPMQLAAQPPWQGQPQPGQPVPAVTQMQHQQFRPPPPPNMMPPPQGMMARPPPPPAGSGMPPPMWRPMPPPPQMNGRPMPLPPLSMPLAPPPPPPPAAT